MSYNMIKTQKEFDNLIGDHRDCVKNFEIIFFGSNKKIKDDSGFKVKIEDFKVKIEDFKEDNIILVSTAKIDSDLVHLNKITLKGRALKYKLIGLIARFDFWGKIYYIWNSSMCMVVNDNSSFSFIGDIDLNDIFNLR